MFLCIIQRKTVVRLNAFYFLFSSAHSKNALAGCRHLFFAVSELYFPRLAPRTLKCHSGFRSEVHLTCPLGAVITVLDVDDDTVTTLSAVRASTMAVPYLVNTVGYLTIPSHSSV